MALLDDLSSKFINNDLISSFRRVGVNSAPGALDIASKGQVSNSTDGSTGSARSQYEFDKYDVGQLTYPSDLLGNDAALSSRNYVIFYINVSVDSRVLKAGTSLNDGDSTTVPIPKDRIRGIAGLSKEEIIAATGVEGAFKGTAAAGILGPLVNRFKPGLGDGALLGGLIKGGSAAILAPNAVKDGDLAPGEEKQPEFSRPQKRLKKAIALYMPNQLKIDYNVNWEDADGAGIEMLARGFKEVGNVLNEGFSEKSLGSASGFAGDVLKSLALSASDKKIGIGAGLAVNPKKEQAFNGVEFRKFSFTYMFSPRDINEAQAVLNIIHEFKYHMHPEFLNESAFTYIYPSEFDVVYYNGPTENLNIHKHTSCVLVSMDLDYTPNGNFVTFPNGMPTQIQMTLNFKELATLTKETIERNL